MIDCLKPLSKEQVDAIIESFKKEHPVEYWEHQAAMQKKSKRITVTILCIVFTIIYTLTVLLLTKVLTIFQIVNGLRYIGLTVYFGFLITIVLVTLNSCIILPLKDELRYARRKKEDTRNNENTDLK